MKGTEDYLTTKSIGERLDTSVSNVRKWSMALEKSGYEFDKSEAGKRYYTAEDEQNMFRLKFLLNKGLALDVAAHTVVSGIERNRSSSGTLDESQEQTEDTHSSNVPAIQGNNEAAELLKSLAERFQEQERLNIALMNKLEEKEEQSRLDRERLEKKIDSLQNKLLADSEQRDKKLMEGIRQLQEQKQEMIQIAAAKEEEEAQNKKGFLSRLFNR